MPEFENLAPLVAVDDRIETLTTELGNLLAKGQRNTPTRAQETRIDELTAQLQEARDRRAVLVSQYDKIKAAASNPANRIPGDARAIDEGPRRSASRTHNRYSDPWENRVDPMGTDPQELRDRALSALDETRSPGNDAMPPAPEDRPRVDR